MDIDSRRSKATLFVGLAVFALVELGSTGTSSGNQITLYNGDLDVNGGDIVDGGTTIWDGSTSHVPSDALDGSGLTWSDFGISKSDVSPSEVGTTASDVGLGNVLNKEQLAVDGSNSMSGDLDIGGNQVVDVDFITGSSTDIRSEANYIEPDFLGNTRIVAQQSTNS